MPVDLTQPLIADLDGVSSIPDRQIDGSHCVSQGSGQSGVEEAEYLS